MSNLFFFCKPWIRHISSLLVRSENTSESSLLSEKELIRLLSDANFDNFFLTGVDTGISSGLDVLDDVSLSSLELDESSGEGAFLFLPFGFDSKLEVDAQLSVLEINASSFFLASFWLSIIKTESQNR